MPFKTRLQELSQATGEWWQISKGNLLETGSRIQMKHHTSKKDRELKVDTRHRITQPSGSSPRRTNPSAGPEGSVCPTVFLSHKGAGIPFFQVGPETAAVTRK